MKIVESHYSLGETKLAVSEIFNHPGLVEKTGIDHVYQTRGSSVSLALKACNNIKDIRNKDIKACILVTQSPDDSLPSNSIVLAHKLGLPKDCLTFDFNQGCSGFVQALCVVENLLSKYDSILLITVDRYRSKLKNTDRSTNAVFSDGASATLISKESNYGIIYEDHYTDGGKRDLLFQSNDQNQNNGKLFMDGAKIWVFTRQMVVPQIIKAIDYCEDNDFKISGIYLHQASKVVVEGMKSLLPVNKKIIFDNYYKFGNTVSSTIPILINDYPFDYESTDDYRILAGFGVGLTSTVIVHGPKE